jgi:GNAT superfamily N-acetyltransferase
MTVVVREAEASDEGSWRRLWSGYLAHLDAAVPDEVTAHTWARILDPASPVFCRLAVADGAVVGFAVCLLHEGSWALTPHCYLEDLFVAPESRGRGAGRALIEDIRALARAKGWNRLYWHTREDNPARRLYDGFAEASGMVVYKLTP